MKKLYLVRHAKASGESPGLADIDRPLIRKGVERTERVIDFLKKKNIKIDLMITSPAERASATARIMAQGLGYPVDEIKTELKIYDGYYDRILDVIYATDDAVESLMIFGHNPTISHLANLFLHPGIKQLPTTGTVCISFDTDKWNAIPGVEPVKDFVITPKKLK